LYISRLFVEIKSTLEYDFKVSAAATQRRDLREQ